MYFLVHPPAYSEKIMGTTTATRAKIPLKKKVILDNVREESIDSLEALSLYVELECRRPIVVNDGKK